MNRADLERRLAQAVELGRRWLLPDAPLRTGWRRLTHFLDELPWWLEWALFAVVALVAVAVRWQAIALVPSYVWRDDSPGYALPAFVWLDSGQWIFDGKRGPVYTIFIGYAARYFGGMNGVMIAQHVLCLVSVGASVAAARVWFGRSATWLIAPCGAAFALYGPPVHYAHLIRNETMLFTLASIALAAWVGFFRGKGWAWVWLLLAGLAAGALTLTKNVYLPFPVLVVAGAFWVRWDRKKLLLAVVHASLFTLAFLAPFGLKMLHEKTAKRLKPERPQAGILLYGRTAQWTYLEGGIEPEFKKEIRGMVEEYRVLPKLDNNIIIYDTVIPRLWTLLAARGPATPSDLNRLCMKLALEAIRTHPREYAQQTWKDIQKTLFRLGERRSFLEPKELSEGAAMLRRMEEPHPVLEVNEMAPILERRASEAYLEPLGDMADRAWLFPESPAWHALIGVTLLLLLAQGSDRMFWLAHGMLLIFTVVLLSTVGRPLNRYLVPAMPSFFWIYTGVWVHGWRWLRSPNAEQAVRTAWTVLQAIWERVRSGKFKV